MSKARNHQLSTAGIVFAGLLSGVCHAAPPNDNWVDRTVIGALPFAQTTPNILQATSETTDPVAPCIILTYPTAGKNSVWYEFTTGETEQFVDLDAGDYDALIEVLAGSPKVGFTIVRGGCNDDQGYWSRKAKLVGLRLAANTRYSIMVSAFTYDGIPPLTLKFSMKPSTVYRVTKTDDTADGTCDADCSLREAVAQAELVPGAIVVPAGTYVVPGGLTPTTEGAIYGAGMRTTVIKGESSGHVLWHSAEDRLTYALHDLTLTRGNVPAGANPSLSSGGAFRGADGYYVLDRVALLDSRSATGNGGGAYFGFDTSLSIYDSVVAGNTADLAGGGIYFRGSYIEAYRSTIAGNNASTGAGADGGGLYIAGDFGVRLVNTTISGNSAADEGGGVYIGEGEPSRRIVINNSTIANNTIGAALLSSNNGGLKFTVSEITNFPPVITNTVLSGNHLQGDPTQIADCSVPAGFALQTGYNLVQGRNGCAFTAPGDLTGVDPLLLPLSTFGTIPVHVPADRSPLVDTGDPGSTCERADARGAARPADGDADGTPRCDIGAVEKTGPGEGGDLIFANSFE